MQFARGNNRQSQIFSKFFERREQFFVKLGEIKIGALFQLRQKRFQTFRAVTQTAELKRKPSSSGKIPFSSQRFSTNSIR